MYNGNTVRAMQNLHILISVASEEYHKFHQEKE